MPRQGLRAAAALFVLTALALWALPTGCPAPRRDSTPTGDGGVDAGGSGQPDASSPEVPDASEQLPTRLKSGLEVRPANPTCVAPPRPQAATGVTTAPAFPKLTFAEPLFALQAPGDDSRVYVVERGGRIRVFANDDTVATASTFADLSGKVDAVAKEGGLLGMAFHPDFAHTGEVFLSYTTHVGALYTIGVSRFTSHDGGATLDVKSEEPLFRLEKVKENHNGGGIAFGPDGYLYVGLGDGGPGGDPELRAQNLDLLFGKILRLDVNGARPYAIPPDNPFLGKSARPEIWAYGFRNPWRWSFDRQTGEMWVGDVGERTMEEVDKVVAGGNYGWSIMEGTACFQGAGCRGPNLKAPVIAYGRDEGITVTGGYVYRGARVPALAGQYVYGDYNRGHLWAYDTSAPVGKDNPRLLATTPYLISSFGELNDGELLLMDIGGGKLYRFGPSGTPLPQKSPLATRLSQTGCVDPADPRKPASGVLAYAVNAPLWSDGAEKERSLAVPDGTTVQVAEDGRFEFPPGSVLMKTFLLKGRRVETRLFMRHPDGQWGGYTYEWNDAQTDAVLLETGKRKDVDGQVWTFPSRGECMTCHNAAAGRVLGPEVAQLNRDQLYPGALLANQLETLEHIGVLEKLPGPVDTLPRLAHPFGEAPLEDRARAYLHANCGLCHRPAGPGRGTADFRFDTPLAKAGICNAPPEVSDLGVPDARLVVPGDPLRSLVWLRMHERGANQMPPLGTAMVDPDGVALVEAWIRSLSACPGP